MREVVSHRFSSLVDGGILFVIGLVGFAAAQSSFFRSESSVVDVIGDVEPEEIGHHQDSIQIWYQALAFDPETRKAWPSPELAKGFTSSTFVREDFDFFVDEVFGQAFYRYRRGDVAGAIDATFDVVSMYRNSRPFDAVYPFDTYVLDTYAKVMKPNGSLESPGRRAFEFFYSNAVVGFDVRYERFAGWRNDMTKETYESNAIVSEREQGDLALLVTFSRTTAVKFSVILLIAVMSLNLFSLCWTTRGVLRQRRPPSMQALVWSAASVLGTIQLRDLFPGDPRLGIGLDYFIFFPTLIGCIVVSLLLTISWSRREDFCV
jgi:hypothetical protein